MRWLFAKDGAELSCELRCERTEGPYLLVVTKPDGSESLEEIDQPTDVVERTAEIMKSLSESGWALSSP